MKAALYKSLALHAVVFLLCMLDLPLFWHEDAILSQPPIIVDLEQVKISEMTNLPAKAKFAEEEKLPAARPVPPQPAKPKPPAPKPEPKPAAPEMVEEAPAPAEEAPAPVKEDFVVPPQPAKPKPPAPKKQPAQKPAAKPAAKPKKPEPKKAKPQVSALKNLMDSVNRMEQKLGETETPTFKQGTETVNMGIEGGSGGSYFSELSISETDAIAARLRQCWNLDPGAMGIEEMVVEIRAYLNRDGTVREVEILDRARYNADVYFRSVADSARRAVYICQPYAVLPQKYGDKYDVWKTMLLRFDPVSHSVR